MECRQHNGTHHQVEILFFVIYLKYQVLEIKYVFSAKRTIVSQNREIKFYENFFFLPLKNPSFDHTQKSIFAEFIILSPAKINFKNF